MTDGTIMAHQYCTSTFKAKIDPWQLGNYVTGSSVTGTWSQAPSMQPGYGPFGVLLRRVSRTAAWWSSAANTT